VFAKGKLEPKFIAIKEICEKYQENSGKKLSIGKMCSWLNVSRSAYYKWLNRKPSAEELENQMIAQWILEYDEKYNHTLGYRRMRNYINRNQDKNYSKNRIHRLMKLLGIKSEMRRTRHSCTKSTPCTAENILKRDFYASAPNQKWTTDVTEFRIPMDDRKLYLSAILDLYDRSIVSYALSYRNDNLLVFNTFDKAIEKYPDAHPLFHSDRGFQYTSTIFQEKLSVQGMEQSMSRVGNCIDNGPTEGFWGILKTECFYNRTFQSIEELIKTIEEYLHYYNYERYQERFNNLAPMEVREAALHSKNPDQYPIPENKKIIAFWMMIKEKQQRKSA
jgi:transposase InsO family protein